MEDFMESYFEKYKETMNLVSSEDYLQWLEDYTNVNGKFSDDDLLYDSESRDRQNSLALSYFFSYLSDKTKEQSVFEIGTDYGAKLYFKYHEKYYEIELMQGQGAITFITLLDKTPNHFYDFDMQDLDQLRKDRELIQYFIVNKDLNMSVGKIAAQVAHASSMCTEVELNSEKYQAWKNSDYKKVVLTAHESEMGKLAQQEDCYIVRDKGLTEIPPNSLTVISLGIKTREEARPLVKRLQLLK